MRPLLASVATHGLLESKSFPVEISAVNTEYSGVVAEKYGGHFASEDVQRARWQARPVAPHRLLEAFPATFVHPVVRPFRPLHVGPETGAAGQIQGQVDAQAVGVGQGIDQPLGGRFAAQLEVVPLGEALFRPMLFRQPVHQAGERHRAEAGGVDQALRAQLERLVRAFHGEGETPRPAVDMRHPVTQGDHRAVVFRFRGQTGHQAVAVDDAAGGALQRLLRAQPGRLPAQPLAFTSPSHLRMSTVRLLILQ